MHLITRLVLLALATRYLDRVSATLVLSALRCLARMRSKTLIRLRRPRSLPHFLWSDQPHGQRSN